MTETEIKHDVFLNHNGKDKPAVEHIARLSRDGGEYKYKVAYEEAERMLEQLGG